MGLESGSFINDLNSSNPEPTDSRSAGDDHIRLIKALVKATLPNGTRAQYFPRSTGKTADFAILATEMEQIFVADCTADHIDVTLPALNAGNDGWLCKVVKSDASANTVRIAGTINGDADGFTLSLRWQAIILMWTGTVWIAFHPIVMTDNVPSFSALSASGLLTLSSTGYMLPPRGTTAQRPGADLPGALRYNSTLGILEWQDNSDQWRQPSIAQPIAAGFKNLIVKNNVANPNTQIDIDADAITVEDSNGLAYRLRSVDVTINTSATGANGMDVGGLANSEWYAALVIYNPETDTVAGLAVDEDNFPASITLPSGYTAWARVAWRRTTSAGLLHRIRQMGRKAQYVVSATVTTQLPIIVQGVGGSTYHAVTPTYATPSLVEFIPSTASMVGVVLVGNFSADGVALAIAASNGSYNGLDSDTPPPLAVDRVTANQGVCGWFVVEGTTFAYAASNAGGALLCLGWEDNL